jgi:hypothetical protein
MGWAGPAQGAEVQIALGLNSQTFSSGSTLTIALTLVPPGAAGQGDLYLAALTPSQSLVFLGPGLTASASPVTFDRGRRLTSGMATLGSVVLTSAVPPGRYQLYGLLVRPGTSPFEPVNHLSNLATTSLTFGGGLPPQRAARLADQAVETPALALRTVNEGLRPILRSLAGLRGGPGRSQRRPCPETRILDLIETRGGQGVRVSLLFDYGAGCRDDDGEFRRGSFRVDFEVTEFDPEELEPRAGQARLTFQDLFEEGSVLSGTVTITFAPGREDLAVDVTETSPEETLAMRFRLTSTFQRASDIDIVNGAGTLRSNVEGDIDVRFENVAFDQEADIDPFTCADPIGGRLILRAGGDVAVLRFGLPSPGCGSAFLSINGGPEQLVRLAR